MQEIINRLRKFREARDWGKYHTPKQLAMSIAIEAAELMECYQWDGLSDDARERVEAEAADVFIYLLNFADVMGIDLVSAAEKKINANEKKYPA